MYFSFGNESQISHQCQSPQHQDLSQGASFLYLHLPQYIIFNMCKPSKCN